MWQAEEGGAGYQESKRRREVLGINNQISESDRGVIEWRALLNHARRNDRECEGGEGGMRERVCVRER